MQVLFRYMVLTATVVGLWYCTPGVNKDEKGEVSEYPQIIVENHFEELYDRAKWELYKKNAVCHRSKWDTNYNFLLSDSLRFVKLWRNNDTIVEIPFQYQRDEKLDRLAFFSGCTAYHSVAFDKRSREITYWGVDDGVQMDNVVIRYPALLADEKKRKELIKRYDTIPPEQIEYEEYQAFYSILGQHADILNPWLRNAAIKHKDTYSD